ncbi:MAG TPA: TRAP transporter substrate-binding protein [Aestuariivirgaceae bacterium]|nr:TRAP transporter substrate-binding protein [Aestuariivirgaceae bacterium]
MRVAVASAAFAISIAFSSIALADTTLRIHSWASPKHLINVDIIPVWCADVEKATQGRVKCEVSYPPNAAPPSMFDRARTGIGDVTWGLPSYSPGRFLLTEIAELPGVSASSFAMTQAFWRTHERYLAKADEFRGVKLLGLMLTTPGVFQTRFPVKDFGELPGKKMRVPGGVAARIAERLEIVGIAAPANKVYEMLQQGVIDGAMMPPETALSFRLMEVAKHMTLVPGGLYYTSFFWVMNENTWGKISKPDQAAVDKVSGEHFARVAGRAFDKWDPIGLKAAKENGVAVTTASDALMRQIGTRMQPVVDAWVAEARKKGVDSAAALQYFKSEADKLEKR